MHLIDCDWLVNDWIDKYYYDEVKKSGATYWEIGHLITFLKSQSDTKRSMKAKWKIIPDTFKKTEIECIKRKRSNGWKEKEWKAKENDPQIIQLNYVKDSSCVLYYTIAQKKAPWAIIAEAEEDQENTWKWKKRKGMKIRRAGFWSKPKNKLLVSCSKKEITDRDFRCPESQW